MSDKWTAINSFWNSFDLDAYDVNTVPKNASMPYITYEASVGGLDQPVLQSASLWYRSPSWQEISQKALDIEESIGGGSGVEYTGGRMWVTKGTPFAQRMNEPSDDMVRRMVLQVAVEFH